MIFATVSDIFNLVSINATYLVRDLSALLDCSLTHIPPIHVLAVRDGWKFGWIVR